MGLDPCGVMQASSVGFAGSAPAINGLRIPSCRNLACMLGDLMNVWTQECSKSFQQLAQCLLQPWYLEVRWVLQGLGLLRALCLRGCLCYTDLLSHLWPQPRGMLHCVKIL